MRLFTALMGGCLLAVLLAGGACATSSMVKERNQACRVMAETTYKNLRVAQEIHYLEQGGYTTDIQALIQKGYHPPQDVQARLLTAQPDGWTVEITVDPCKMVVPFDSRKMDQ